MLATVDMDGTQKVVHATYLHGLAVYGARPAGIVHFAEHQHTAVAALHVVLEFVGFVRGEHGRSR